MKKNCIGGFIFEAPDIVNTKGRNAWIGRLLRNKIWYLGISIGLFFKFKLIRNDKDYYYDGYHNSLWLGFICIWWGE